MSTPMAVRSTRRARTRPRFTLTSPMFPEGMATLILLLLITGCAGVSVQQADWARIVVPVPAIALIAAGLGSLLAKLRVLDSIAHLVSVVIGASLSFGLVVFQASEFGASWRERIAPLGELVLGWYLGREILGDEQTYLVSILVGFIVWLMGYLSAWTLFRRGWILVSLLLPGLLILVNLGYAENPDTRYVLVFGFLCIPLVARFHLYSREREWHHHQLASPGGFPARFLLIGAAVAIIATSIGWRSPASLSQRTFQPLAGEISTQFLSAQERAAGWVRDRTGGIPVSGEAAGSYSSFDADFSVGGPLRLSDTPQALVSGDEAPYLVAQRYDEYSGRGWSSTSDQTFNGEGADGRQYSPEMTFGAGQDVPLSPSVTTGRDTGTVRITALGPSTRRLLTVDTYLAADRGASVRMGWRQLQDVPFALDSDLSDLPPDLQTIAGLLQGADLTGVEEEGGPGASDPQLQRRIEEERQGLIPRFLTVRWTANADGLADTLYVTGQVPIYDDVDSVFSRTAVEPGMAYEVSAARSLVADDVLARASTAYPDWVQDRYLSLPETVTPRTVALAHQLTESSSTPLEKARIIESFVRTTIAYDEGVSAPPDDVDMVDYVLFERQRGYCEYYASAMAVMLRSVGVPARVAVGFYPGEYDPEQRGTVYRQKNAHAWVEVFFPDYGWVSFEPTASRPLMDSGSAGPLEPTPPEATPPLQDGPPELSTPTPSLDDAATPAAPPPVATPVVGGSGLGWAWPVVIAASIFAGLAGIGWVLWMLPLHGAAPSSALFLRLRRLGRFLGIPAAATETPREYARSFTAAVPASREHVARIVSAYELDQFGPDPVDNRVMSTATGAWRSMRRQVPSWILQRRFGRK